MLRLCTECSSNSKIEDFINKTFRPLLDPETSDSESESDSDEERIITFKEWVSTDRCELITRCCNVNEFLIKLKDELIN